MPHHSVQWSLSFGSQSKGKGSLRRTLKSSLREKWSHDTCRPTFYLRYCIFSRILYLLFDYWPSYMLLFHSGVHLDDSVWTEYAIEVVIVEHTSSTTTSFHLERDIVSYKYKHTCSGGHQSAEATTYYNNQIKESSNSLKHVQIFFLFLATFLFVKGPPLLGLYVQGISGKKMQRGVCE